MLTSLRASRKEDAMSWFENQIEERREADARLLEDSLVQISGVIMGERKARQLGDERMITRNNIDEVLKYYGCKPVEIPESITNPMEQLEYALRPHGIMYRMVDLTKGWYRDAYGPMLSRTADRTPITLIPSPVSGYTYNDPETGASVKVNAKTAANISEKGIVFYKPLPQKEIDAFKAENARVKKLYLEYTGVKEKTAAELKAEADNKYVQDIINQNYLLNDLTDKNRQAKAVADYKAKVNAKVKEKLAPTKILGTYSTSFAWQGLPLQNYPELKEKYSSVQEMQFKTFYQKGGKYYVVKSAFRQSIDQGDNLHGAQPQKFYWPGLETPVEIPADKIQGKF